MTDTPNGNIDRIDMSALGHLQAEPIVTAEPAADATTVFLYNMDKLEAAKALLGNGETLQSHTGWSNIGSNSMNTVKHRFTP